MPKLKISEGQVFDLIKQLPRLDKKKILSTLILDEGDRFFETMEIGEEKFQSFCNTRGINPNKLSEKEKETLIDNILHEAE